MGSSFSDNEDKKFGLSSPSERGPRGEAVIAIIDVGKTNKKLFLFDQAYQIVYEQSARFTETTDEDGFPCEDVERLSQFVFDSLRDVVARREFAVKAINFSTYGASFVYLDEEGKVVAPLYNYLKPYPEELKRKFYDTYGGEEEFSFRTASPVLGSLNSGMQLYRIKYENPHLFKQIKYALHLPQYMSFLLTRNVCSDITSIGCHTNLWDFQKNDYHEWVYKEGIIEKLPPITPCDTVSHSEFGNCLVGIGLHDSSAALIPYLVNFHEPFVLISTGTWSISLNPFNDQPLTVEELKHDCLSFLQFQQKPVKAARLFAGNEHEEQVERIADHFNQNAAKYQTMNYNRDMIRHLEEKIPAELITNTVQLINESLFAKRDLNIFESDEEAYHQLMRDIITRQKVSTELVLKGTSVNKLFVDGGFGKNNIFMTLLAGAFPSQEVFAASMAQATALGTALAIHQKWNAQAVPDNIIELKYYPTEKDVVFK